jgi:putative transposase
MLALVFRPRFEKLVKEHKHEFGAKGMRSWTHFASMLFAQISGQHGLRGIETAMNSQRNSFYHLGIAPGECRGVSRSTLSYANKHRSADLFKALFETMLEKAQSGNGRHGFRFKNPLYSMDSTTIDLCLSLCPWADFRKNKGGIKLTVKLDHRGKIPCFVTESNAREHDIKKGRQVPFEAGDVAVFDRGYTDYGYFSSLNDKNVWFITRMKKNAVYRIVNKRETFGKNVISDYEIKIPQYSQTEHLRKIIIRDPKTKKRITLVTNNKAWAASTIGAVYKDRWQIELFFKAIKQNLKIKRFYGNSKNAVMTQIWIALIVYLIYYLLKAQSRNIKINFTNFIHVIRTMLFQRISLSEWLIQPAPLLDPGGIHSLQREFIW